MERMADEGFPHPRIEARRDLERPGAVREALAELRRLAATGAPAADRLRELASPEALDVLFRVALGTSLRRGPAATPEAGSPHEWLDLAAAAARAGASPVATVAELRDSLDEVAGGLRRSGAWAVDAPLWWWPLPDAGPLESLWRELGPPSPTGRAVGLPPEDPARRAFAAGDPPAGRGWVSWADAVPPPLLARVSAELASAAGGRLGLRSAGVGRSGRRSARRNDAVRYLTGLEPDLLRRAPTLALLVQHFLGRLEAPLRRVLPGLDLHAPQTAMLARYAAPCPGFAAHLDNPGGGEDNGRVLSLVVYLNPPDRPCRGGGLALWPGAAPADGPPAMVLPPAGGSAVLFDARTVAHAVEPVEAGPERWTLVLWWSDRPRRPARPLVAVPPVRPADVLRAVEEPPLAPGSVLFRPVAGEAGASAVRVARSVPGRRPRAALVATVAEAGAALGGWCRHHLDLGFDRLVVVLDRESSPREVEELETLRRSLGHDRIEVWSAGEAAARRRALPPFDGREELLAAAERGTATWAVAARQALNATAALHAVRSAAGSAPLDWLVHLDGDELLVLEGSGRGGASLGEHFAAAEALGWRTLRYLNHELLLPWRPGEAFRFKRNPALAAERLGPLGWRKLARLLAMEQGDRRPYFRAYRNGKGAVAVAAGSHAAGVHGWHVPGDGEEPLLAGPSVLHVHLPTAEAFRRKYLRVAESGETPDAAARPFPPSVLERAAWARLQELRRNGAGAADVVRGLDALYAETATFTVEAVALLDEAGLLFTPELRHLPIAEPAAVRARR